MGVQCLKHFGISFILFMGLVQANVACTTVLTASKSAFDSQITFMRRGLLAETAKSLFAEFIANLAVKAWETGPVGTPFGDVCIPDEYLSQLQDEQGRLLSSTSITDSIAASGAKVPLMTEAQLATTNFAGHLSTDFWTSTSAYIMGHIPLVINISRLEFPSESEVRIEPYQSEACFQFQQKFDKTEFVEINAQNWTANVLSLVLKLIDVGAESNKAMQLLKHSAAYTYVGMRCSGNQKSDLMIPTVFVRDYARQSGALSQNLGTSTRRDLAPLNLLLTQSEMIGLITTFSSDGRLPATVVSANGDVRNITYDWESVADAEKTFEMAKKDLPDTSFYYQTVQSAINAAISAIIARDSDLTFTISRSAQNTTEWPFWPISRRKTPFQDLVQTKHYVPAFSRNLLPLRSQEKRESERNLKVSVRQTCGAEWEFFEIEGATPFTKQCCASICVDVAEGLPPAVAIQFTEECCGGCSEYECLTSAEAAAEGAAEVLEIELPPYGSSEGESIPIMI